MRFDGRGILLDIEGTTSSVQYVYEILFPYVRDMLGDFLRKHWNAAEVVRAREQLAREAGADSFADWCGFMLQPEREAKLAVEVHRLMDADVKSTGLKDLQGLIWRQGFETGELHAHVFPDVPEALKRWRQAGKDVRIYSSGSIAAQQLFFGHTEAGSLLPYLNGHYDTTTGPKKEAESYRKIAAAWGQPANKLLFISDVPAELDAARAAGMQTVLALRLGNAPVDAACTHPRISSFDEVSCA